MTRSKLFVMRLKLAGASILFALAGLAVLAPKGHAQSGEGCHASTSGTTSSITNGSSTSSFSGA
jgi:hypothetical protein